MRDQYHKLEPVLNEYEQKESSDRNTLQTCFDRNVLTLSELLILIVTCFSLSPLSERNKDGLGFFSGRKGFGGVDEQGRRGGPICSIYSLLCLLSSRFKCNDSFMFGIFSCIRVLFITVEHGIVLSETF